jgi:hypothetical protein
LPVLFCLSLLLWLFWLSFPSTPVSAFWSWQTCSGSPVLPVIFFLPRPARLFYLSVLPVPLPDLLWLSSCLSCSGCLFWLSCTGCHYLAVPFWLSRFGCPSFDVIFWLSFSGCLPWLSLQFFLAILSGCLVLDVCLGRPVLAVRSW